MSSITSTLKMIPFYLSISHFIYRTGSIFFSGFHSYKYFAQLLSHVKQADCDNMARELVPEEQYKAENWGDLGHKGNC